MSRPFAEARKGVRSRQRPDVPASTCCLYSPVATFLFVCRSLIAPLNLGVDLILESMGHIWAVDLAALLSFSCDIEQVALFRNLFPPLKNEISNVALCVLM